MFQKLMDLMAGAGDALGVEIPTDFGVVSDAVAQVTEVTGVSDVLAGAAENGIAGVGPQSLPVDPIKL
jgi:hypothetical protein